MTEKPLITSSEKYGQKHLVTREKHTGIATKTLDLQKYPVLVFNVVHHISMYTIFTVKP